MPERPGAEWGRGLAAILSVRAPRGRRRSCAQLPLELISPNPHQPRDPLRRDGPWLRWAESIKARGGAPAGPGPPLCPAAPTSSSPASAAGAPPSWPSSSRCRPSSVTTTDAASLEVALIENHGPARTSTPVEEGPALLRGTHGGSSVSRARKSAGASGAARVAVSNLIRLLDLPDETLESIQAGDLSEGPWPGPPARVRPRRSPPPWAGSRFRNGWSVPREPSTAPGGTRSDNGGRRRHPPVRAVAHAACIPTKRPRSPRSVDAFEACSRPRG